MFCTIWRIFTLSHQSFLGHVQLERVWIAFTNPPGQTTCVSSLVHPCYPFQNLFPPLCYMKFHYGTFKLFHLRVVIDEQSWIAFLFDGFRELNGDSDITSPSFMNRFQMVPRKFLLLKNRGYAVLPAAFCCSCNLVELEHVTSFIFPSHLEKARFNSTSKDSLLVSHDIVIYISVFLLANGWL